MWMKSVYRILSPLLLGVVMFNCIRFTTDLLRYETPWAAGPMKYHLYALLVTIGMCYVFDFESRYFLSRIRPKLHISVVAEYLGMALSLFILMNLVMFVGEQLGVLYMGNDLTDYVVTNVIYIPLFLIYYIILRSHKIEVNYHEQTLQLEKIRADQLEMELKFLRSQYHPHFLFNALNTVYFQIDEKNAVPRHTLETLSGLLRYQLYGGTQKVPIQKEIEYLETYMRLQKMRMTERLILNTSFSPSLTDQQVYPLLFLPLVENAFKYVGGTYHINLDMSWQEGCILFEIANSVPEGMTVQSTRKGIGLENLRRRLELLYPDAHQLDINEEPQRFSVKLLIETETICR